MRLRRLARSPLAYWVAVVALAAFTASTIAGQVNRAGAQAARYGRLRPVVTAARAVEVGAVVRAADVVVRPMPAAFLPGGALTRIDDAMGRTAVVPLFRGRAVVAAHLAPDGLEGLAALLPAGGRAVAVPTGPASVALRRGTGSTSLPPSTRRRRARSRRSPSPKPPWWSTWAQRPCRWPSGSRRRCGSPMR